MKKIKNTKVVFKEYNQNQQYLIPPSVEDLISDKHLVRTVNTTIEQMNLEPLLEKYKGGGTSSYHPKMMLKILIYGYIEKLYSSRRIAKALRENVNFMWLSGNNRPDFRTINMFRASKMKEVIEQVFFSLVELLMDKQLIKLENYFLDGTKIEANANKYSWVWKKSTKRYKQQLQKKTKELLTEIDKINEKENQQYCDSDLEELGEESTITAEDIEKKAKELNDILAKKSKDKKLKKSVKKMAEDYLPRLKKYEEQENILQERNSYSKTDPDATFMRLKKDHMKNDQLKPSYNVQIGTENQFIVNYSIHQKPGDTTLLIPHMQKLKDNLDKFPQNIIADAGYGSEENYDFVNKNKMNNFIKFNYFHAEQKKKFKENKFRVENLEYNKEKDEYTCPSGKPMKFKEIKEKETENGYTRKLRLYEVENCKYCRLKKQCHKSKNNRVIQVSEKLNKYKAQARKNLWSELGLIMRSLRPQDVESVFGHIKSNRLFERFMLKGLEKVNIEWGLLSISHNIMKISA